ncbi:MAG: replicative DNA helicase [Calditrichia bacterium]
MARRKKDDKPNLTEISFEKGARVPPQAVEVEKAVLGAMLIEKEAVGIAVENIDETVFYREAHRKIFLAIAALYEQNEPVDLITLTEELKRRDQLEEIGGSYYLAELATQVPSAANVEYHLRIVRDKALLRRLIVSCSNIIKNAYDEEDDAEKILDYAEAEVLNVSQSSRRKSYEWIKPVIKETLQELEKLHQTAGDGIIGVPSGYRDLDNLLAGFHRSDLVILAGRPAMGKTAFALNLARNAAVEHGYGVGIFSLEMSNQQLVQRLLCQEAEIDQQKLRTGRLSEDEWPKLSRRIGRLVEAPIYIDDTPSIDVLKLRARARRMAAERGVQMIIVDYLQLMESPRMESRQQEISYISRSLKTLAKELNIPILALSQLSRAVEARTDRRPTLADLRESGAIEQDADVVMFVYRPEVYGIPNFDDEEKTPTENMVEIIVGKHRHGPIGSAKLVFMKHHGKFLNYASHVAPAIGGDAGF